MPESSRDGMGTGTITSRPAPCPRPAPELDSLRPRAVRPQRAEASLRSMAAWLGACPPPEPWAASLSSPGTCTRWCGVNRRRAWCGISGDHAWNGTYIHGKVCKAPFEEGGARMEQSMMKRTNWTKIAQIDVNFVRNSYEFHRNFCIHTLV